MSRPLLYSRWTSMISRCENPNDKDYHNYGGRGITVCKAWRESYWKFERFMGPPPTPGHTIDRIDNDAGYFPWNCRWATRQEQSDNRRTSLKWDWGGHCLTLIRWSALLEVPFDVLAKRLEKHGHLFKTRNTDFHYKVVRDGRRYVEFSLGRQNKVCAGRMLDGEDAWDTIIRTLQA